MPKLIVIEIKSLKRLGKAKIDKIDNKYGNSNGITKEKMSVVKTSSKVYKPKTYKEIITDFIYSK